MKMYSKIGKYVAGAVAGAMLLTGCATTQQNQIESAEHLPKQGIGRRIDPLMEEAKGIVNKYGNNGEMNKNQFCEWVGQYFFSNSSAMQVATNGASVNDLQARCEVSSGTATLMEGKGGRLSASDIRNVLAER
jgi:hypothetical protein